MHANTLDAVWAFAQMNQRVLAEPIELPPSVAKESLGLTPSSSHCDRGYGNHEGRHARLLGEYREAMVAHRKTRGVRDEQEVLVTSAQRALALAELRYVTGLATYLDVLDAQR